LDSFSEPDIAVAVLKKHAQELRETCTFEINLARERDLRAHWTLKTPPQHYLDQPLEQPLNRMRSASDAMPISSRESGSASAFQAGLAQWIPRLRAELKRQSQAAADAELAHMYLMLCKAGGQWEAFLDVYLGMLIASPEHNDVPSWAPVALSQARFYGRTEEILDALQHMIRFHRDRDAAARIQVAVDRWLACNRSNYTVQVR
jgi:hypothetical protein